MQHRHISTKVATVSVQDLYSVILKGRKRNQRTKRRRKQPKTRVLPSVVGGLGLLVFFFYYCRFFLSLPHTDRRNGNHHERQRLDPRKLAELRQRLPSKLLKVGGPSNRTIYKPLRNLSKEFLEGLDDDVLKKDAETSSSSSSSSSTTTTTTTTTTTSTTTSLSPSNGKEKLLGLLYGTGATDIDKEAIKLLPTWSQVTQLYGDKPVIHGLEQCRAFREAVPPTKASLGPAGLFNTGTNVLSSYLETNCWLPRDEKHQEIKSAAGQHFIINNGLLWQVPWGKHYPASARRDHTNPSMVYVDKSSVLPVVLVRDPYSWMQSMCRNSYSAHWHHSKRHCPNLEPTPEDLKLFPFSTPTIPVRIKYSNDSVYKWDSLVHLWSDWNRQYYDVQTYARLMIRFEDLLFHPQQVVQQVCTCVGGTVRKDFRYYVDSAKYGPGHGATKTSLLTALIRYGRGHHRSHNLTQADLRVARDALDEELMHVFQYKGL